jgi:hypothetical protein
MTSYAPNFTPRWRGKYVAAGVEHTIQLRTARGASFAALDTAGPHVSDVFSAFASLLADDFAWISAEIALTDSDVFSPGTIAPGVTGTVDATTFSPIQKITATSFTGRSPGSRGRVSLYGVQWFVDVSGVDASNGVVTTAEFGGVGTAAGLLSSFFAANNGLPSAFPGRATIKENDHLLRLVRRGIIS